MKKSQKNELPKKIINLEEDNLEKKITKKWSYGRKVKETQQKGKKKRNKKHKIKS